MMKLTEYLKVNPGATHSDLQAYEAELLELQTAGKVVYRKSRYYLPEQCNYFASIIKITNSGTAYVNDGETEYRLDAKSTGTAFDGDFVFVSYKQKTWQRKYYVAQIIKRAHTKLTGVIDYYREFACDIKTNAPITITNLDNFETGAIVSVVLVNDDRPLTGEIVSVLGNTKDPNSDVLRVANKHGFGNEFPEAVLKAAEHLKDTPSKRPIVSGHIYTIDGVEAKDLDDAVRVTKQSDGTYLLEVFIADVAYYVRPGSAIDTEASLRTTSLYLADTVIPMLPKRLSNDLCSLNANEPKRVIGCQMVIDATGKITDVSLAKLQVIVSERLSYDQVMDILEDSQHRLYSDVRVMNELREILATRKSQQGSLEFNTVELAFKYRNYRPVELIQKQQRLAEQIIEQFMIAANESVASYLMNLGVETLYRVHGLPEPERTQRLEAFLKNNGINYYLGKRIKHPNQLQPLLSIIEQKPYLTSFVLRALAKAEYAVTNIGHFGLASRAYTHFTAPIRRYADLLVHRLIYNYIFQEPMLLPENLSDTAAYISARERASLAAEYEIIEIKSAQYLQQHLGEIYDGYITGITNFGMFVTLELGIEGFVRLGSLRGYYEYDAETVALVSRHGTYKLGQKVTVEVVGANDFNGNIDFEIRGKTHEAKSNRTRRRPKQKNRS